MKEESILWIDLAGKSTNGSTRIFLLRLTTPAHPWGYKKDDNAGRLDSRKIDQACQTVSSPRRLTRRPFARELFPVEAEAPIPLAWLLLPLGEGLHGEALRAELLKRATQESTGWAGRAATYLTNLRLSDFSGIEQAAMRSLRIAIPILEVPTDATRNIANIEHLFQRLNNGGMPISSEELQYSMIKAYWPSIEKTINGMSPLPVSHSRIALLGARAAFVSPTQLPDRLPGELSIESLRALKHDQGKQNETAQFMQFFGIDSREPIEPPIIKVLKQVESWLRFRSNEDIGIPPVLRTRIAQNSPEVFLLLMIIARIALSRSGCRPDTLRKPILALATGLHWFARDKGRAVRRIYEKLRKTEALEESVFRGWLRAENSDDDAASDIYEILSPERLEEVLRPNGNLLSWNFWQHIVTLPSRDSSNEQQEAKRSKLEHDVWPVVHRIVFDRSREFLLYAQRELIDRDFRDYDDADASMWEDHNRPWDYDHLLAKSEFTNLRSKGGQEPLFRDACAAWGETVGNFHLLPLGVNRSRQEKPANIAFGEYSVSELKLMFLCNDESKNELDYFSIYREEVHGNETKARAFVEAAHRRTVALYRAWYDTLRIAEMQKISPTTTEENTL